MLFKKIVVIFIIFLVVSLSACSLPGSVVIGGPTQDPAVATAAMQTAIAEIVVSTQAGQTQVAENAASTEAAQTELANAVAGTLTAIATNTSEFTLTSSLTPTLTHKPTRTPTLTLTQSLTTNLPHLTVSVETNCRSGPGKAYDILGVLHVGETAEIVGQDFGKGNWIIRLPSKPTIICWVWRNYATTTGDTGPVPVFTPQSTPTPMIGFVLTYDSFTSCSGSFFVKFKIVNNGSMTWESNQVNATDRTTTVTTTINRDHFSNYTGCVLSVNDSNLEPGEVGITTSAGFAANPTGHDFKATVQVCSLDGQGGPCVNKTITFTP
jgi:hypothetical protein